MQVFLPVIRINLIAIGQLYSDVPLKYGQTFSAYLYQHQVQRNASQSNSLITMLSTLAIFLLNHSTT